MKKLILSLLATILFAGACYAGTPYMLDKDVILSSTTGTLVDGIRLNRRYFLIVNPSDYEILCSTYQQKTGDVIGKVIAPNYGFWEEDFYCYVSSYYAIALSTGTAKQVKAKATIKE